MYRILLLLIIVLTASCKKIIDIEIKNYTNEDLKLEFCFDTNSIILPMVDTSANRYLYTDTLSDKASNGQWFHQVFLDSIKNNCGYITIESQNYLILNDIGFIEDNSFKSIKVYNSNYYIEAKGSAIPSIFDLRNKRQARSRYVLEVKK